MFYNNINPVLLQLGSFEIRYYGLFFVIGVLFSYWLLGKLVQERNIDLGKEGVSVFMLYILVGVLIGSRLFSVLSELPYYLANPLQIFMFWRGGLAFHGGLIGGAIATLRFIKKNKVTFYQLADIVMIPISAALALGRIGNFTNGEFYGTPTGLPWGVMFQGVESFRHPVQIYETFAMLIIFALLWWLRNKKLPNGALFWTFITTYGVLRFWLEFYKDLPPLLFGFTWGQLFSIPMILLGSVMLAGLFRKKINNSTNNSGVMEEKQ